MAVNLIPYLLKQKSTGPAFFPPIVAVLLPFQNKRPTSFPALGLRRRSSTTTRNGARSGLATPSVSTASSTPKDSSTGEPRQTVVEPVGVEPGRPRRPAPGDGAAGRRADALRSWQGSGAQFRPFYEHQVESLLREYQVSEVDLAKIEVPVTVCWFPGETGELSRPHEAARKLFVDVNKEARPPSESRIILLSDGELSNVLTRSMLSALRGRSGSYLPLYAVEYDNPEVNTSRPARWSVMTNIHLLKMAVNRCIFGPPKYLTNLAQPISGREKAEERDRFMRTQLDLVSLLPEYLDDAGYAYDLDGIGDTKFPLGRSEALAGRFMDTWGQAILTLLSRTAPYAAHAAALTSFKDSWHTANTHAQLAHDALFGGVGIYWTLRDSYDHYQTNRTQDGPKPPKSDVIRAWEALKEKESEFDEHRAHEYLGSVRPDAIRRCKAAFGVFNTHACQLGMVMTLGSLWEMRKNQPGGADLKDLPAFAEALVTAWNTFFEIDRGRARDRRYAFSKDSSNPINQITNMDTPNAVYFRYFWMQALTLPSVWQHIAPWLTDRDAFDSGLGDARRLYLDLCIKQQCKALEVNQPALSPGKREEQAKKLATSALKKALRNWFEVSDEEFEAWRANQPAQATQGELDLDEEGPSGAAQELAGR